MQSGSLGQVLIVNRNAGGFKSDPEALDLLKDQRDSYDHLFVIPDDPALEGKLSQWAESHRGRGIVVVAGGDGTVRGLLRIIVRFSLGLRILPFGTFNLIHKKFIAGPEAADCKVDECLLSVGELGEDFFLIRASFGVQPQVIRKRGSLLTDRTNRISKIITTLKLAVSTLFSKFRDPYVIKIGSESKRISSGFLFLFINGFSHPDKPLADSSDVSSAELTWERRYSNRLILFLEVLIKRGLCSSETENLRVDRAELTLPAETNQVELDGELRTVGKCVKFTLHQAAIRLLA